YSGLLNLKCTENVRSQFVVLFDYPTAFSAYENAVFGDEHSSRQPLNEKQVISVSGKSFSGCYRRNSHAPLLRCITFVFKVCWLPIIALLIAHWRFSVERN